MVEKDGMTVKKWQHFHLFDKMGLRKQEISCIMETTEDCLK